MSIPPQVRVGVGVFILESSSEPSNNPRFIMGKRLGSVGSGTYALPGGHLDFGETPEECAAREIMEETGLRVSKVQFMTAVNTFMETEGKQYITMFMVCVRDDEQVQPENLEPEKCEGWEWVSWEQLVGRIETASRAPEGEALERKIFLPLLSLARQRPGVTPNLS